MADLLPQMVSTMLDRFAPGTMLGRYELLATIGEGGMARVILARQRGPAGFEKAVVIKVIHPRMSEDQAAVGMLLDEARVAAQINHRNVVQTYELGEAHGTWYIVMEYLHGESLHRMLKAAALGPGIDPRLSGRIIADAAEGLHAAHELSDFSGRHQGIIHRDVSPGNIVVLYDGTVKVVDFGIATTSIATVRTCPGTVRGKASYMSPEQCLGERVDRRTDVFALGVVLYELTVGIRCFAGKGDFDRMLAVVRGEYVRPTSIAPDYPPELETVIERALAVDVIDRYDSAADFAEALAEVARTRGWATGTTPIARVMAERFGDDAGDAEAIEVPSELIVEEAAIADVETMRTGRGRLARGSNVDMLFAGLDEELLTRSRRKLRPRPPTAPVYLRDPAPARADRNSD